MDYVLHPLTLVTFSPLLGVLVILFIKPEQKNLIRWIALLTSLLTLKSQADPPPAARRWAYVICPDPYG
jgi:hypothetical protein